LHSLSVNVETNLLSLVSPWLDKFYQITTKSATETLHPLYTHLNTPLASLQDGGEAVLMSCLMWAVGGRIGYACLACPSRPAQRSFLHFHSTLSDPTPPSQAVVVGDGGVARGRPLPASPSVVSAGTAYGDVCLAKMVTIGFPFPWLSSNFFKEKNASRSRESKIRSNKSKNSAAASLQFMWPATSTVEHWISRCCISIDDD
jgi:hypothetical protein